LTIVTLLALCAACGGGASGGDESGPTGDHLSVRSLSDSEPACEGTFTTGESVEITDPRFAPTRTVTLTVAPTGGTPQTFTLTADIQGVIRQTVRLPDQAGSVYITATGVSATGTDTNETVGIDVLAPGTECG
jgi:hypothetical protein